MGTNSMTPMIFALARAHSSAPSPWIATITMEKISAATVSSNRVSTLSMICAPNLIQKLAKFPGPGAAAGRGAP